MATTYTTPANVAAELRAEVPFSASTFPTLETCNRWIEEYTDYINDKAGRTFTSTEYTEYVDIDGPVDRITTRRTPIITLSSFSVNTAAEGSAPVYVAKTLNTDYIVYEERGEIVPTVNLTLTDGNKRCKIVYTAGYTNTPGSIQMLATKLVALRCLNTLIGKNVNEGNDGGSISVGSINIVEPASYGVNSYSNLKKDVDQLTNELTGGTSAVRY